MARVLRWAVMAALVVTMSACVNASQHMTVHSDGTTDVTTEILIDNSALTADGMSVDDSLAMLGRHLYPPQEGATVRTIKGAERSGFEQTNHFKTLDTALYWLSDSATGDSLYDKATVQQSGNWFRSTRTFTFITDPKYFQIDAQTDAPGIQAPTRSAPSIFDVTVSLTVPESIASANQGARITDNGHTVTWDMPLDRSVTLVTEATSGPPAWFWGVVAAVAAMIAAGIATFFFVRRRSRLQLAGSHPRAGQA